jgi:hypothetical protein
VPNANRRIAMPGIRAYGGLLRAEVKATTVQAVISIGARACTGPETTLVPECNRGTCPAPASGRTERGARQRNLLPKRLQNLHQLGMDEFIAAGHAAGFQGIVVALDARDDPAGLAHTGSGMRNLNYQPPYRFLPSRASFQVAFVEFPSIAAIAWISGDPFSHADAGFRVRP